MPKSFMRWGEQSKQRLISVLVSALEMPFHHSEKASSLQLGGRSEGGPGGRGRSTDTDIWGHWTISAASSLSLVFRLKPPEGCTSASQAHSNIQLNQEPLPLSWKGEVTKCTDVQFWREGRGGEDVVYHQREMELDFTPFGSCPCSPTDARKPAPPGDKAILQHTPHHPLMAAHCAAAAARRPSHLTDSLTSPALVKNCSSSHSAPLNA